MKPNGKLFGVGVGPGDPELITVKAVKAIEAADIIFTAASSKNSYSLAVEIASPYISDAAVTRHLGFPMTKDEKTVEAAWIANAKEIAQELKQGKTVVFLTLGDPTTYSTFGYILKKMKCIMPEADIETIPGITSFHAASARLNRILVEGEESLLITSGAFGGEQVRKAKDVENVAIVKAYKNIRDINNTLKDTGHFEKSIAVSKCGRTHETIIENLQDLETRDPDYWTLILASR
ncbi:MAG TPA: precorrin-2 C(20)-methyltransferase [Desulfobacteraceae bacterium]|nr:precorrin-2 C(20)-methyltransferase [Desulfobacteraceae bacterium]|tara:strand:- start:206 stop:910 length:705 start_codon:yes stop_codon:yes gene_type:complete